MLQWVHVREAFSEDCVDPLPHFPHVFLVFCECAAFLRLIAIGDTAVLYCFKEEAHVAGGRSLSSLEDMFQCRSTVFSAAYAENTRSILIEPMAEHEDRFTEE